MLSLLSTWSAEVGSISTTAKESLASLDPATASRTYTSFPQKRPVNPLDLADYQGLQTSSYDPIFILSLLGACLIDGSIKTSADWTEVGKTNALSVAIAAMSSKQPGMRSLASNILVGVWRAVQVSPLVCICHGVELT